MRGRILNPVEDGVLVELLPEAESPACPGNRSCHSCLGSYGGHNCSEAGCPAVVATMAASATMAAAGSAEYGLCGPVYPVLVRIKKGEQAEYSPGQIVELRRGGLASQTAAALLPPAAGFVLGYAIAGLFAPESGAQAAMGLIFMLVSALGFYLFRRRRQPRLFFTLKRPAPTTAVTEILL